MAAEDEVEMGSDVEGEDLAEMMSMVAKPVEWFYNGVVTPEEPLVIASDYELYFIKLTTVTFGANVKKGSRTVIELESQVSEDKQTVAVLNQGFQETLTCDWIVSSPARISLSGTKPSAVHVSGYYTPVESHVCDPRMSTMIGSDSEGEEDADLADEELTEADEAEIMRQIREKMQSQKKSGKSKNSKKRSREAMAESDEEAEQTQPKRGSEDTKEETGSVPPKKKTKSEWRKVSGGTEVKDVKRGSGPAAKNGDTVTVYYVGQLENKKVFDKCITGPGFEFTIGQGSVIDGWDQGVKGMQVGTKRRLKVPPKQGYGSAGSPPEIPGNATLNFTVELREIN